MKTCKICEGHNVDCHICGVNKDTKEDVMLMDTLNTKPHPCRGCERSTLDKDFNPIKCEKGYKLKGRREACKSYSIYP